MPVDAQGMSVRSRHEYVERQVVAARAIERDLPLNEVVQPRPVAYVVLGRDLETRGLNSFLGLESWSVVLSLAVRDVCPTIACLIRTLRPTLPQCNCYGYRVTFRPGPCQVYIINGLAEDPVNKSSS